MRDKIIDCYAGTIKGKLCDGVPAPKDGFNIQANNVAPTVTDCPPVGMDPDVTTNHGG